MSKKVATIFGASRPKPGDDDYNRSYKVGKLLSEKGYIIRNGGYSGTMEGSSKGAVESSGLKKVEGCITSPTFTKRPKGNDFITKIIDHETIQERLGTLTKEDVNLYVVLPGNIGTFTELILIMCLNYIGMQKVPIFVWKDPFEPVIDLMIKQKICNEEHKKMFTFVESVNEIQKFLEK